MIKKNICALLLCVSTVSLAFVDIASLPHPYNTLPALSGYNTFSSFWNRPYIDKLLKHNTIKTIIEIGSFGGDSTIFMAQNTSDDAIVHAVDIWMEDWLYQAFLSNVIHVGMHNKIKPYRMWSSEASSKLEHLKGKVDLIFVDASHDTKYVYEDLELWYPYIAGKKGIMCGDDWLIRPVQIAVRVFAQRHNLTIYADNNFWFFVETGKYEVKSFLSESDDVWIFNK